MLFNHTKPNQDLAKEVHNRALECKQIIYPKIHHSQYSIKRIKWEKPLPNWYRLNTDGSSLGNLGKAGGGGLIRDHTGTWVGGFASAIGSTPSIIAEHWTLRDGLTLCNQMQIQSLAELDAYVIVNMLCEHNSYWRTLSPLLDDYRNLLSRIPHHKIQHCFREVNRCADTLARMGAEMDANFISFDVPPVCILDQIRLDSLDTLYCRRCISSTITL